MLIQIIGAFICISTEPIISGSQHTFQVIVIKAHKYDQKRSFYWGNKEELPLSSYRVDLNAWSKVGFSIERVFIHYECLGLWFHTYKVGGYEFKVLILSISIYVVRTLHLFLKFYMHNSSKQILPVYFNISLWLYQIWKQKLCEAHMKIFWNCYSTLIFFSR